MIHPLKIIFLLLLYTGQSASAQSFVKSQQTAAQPALILIENFTLIQLAAENSTAENLNTFDISNPYTYIQNITDREEKIYQILFQTDFLGGLHLLAISNNLSELFNNPNKPIWRFNSCIKNANGSCFATENCETAINCILERLNYCSE